MCGRGHSLSSPYRGRRHEAVGAGPRDYRTAAELVVSTDADAAYVLAYDAARKALTAVLENQGLRATSRAVG